jgi:hypothetical protein
MAPSDSLISGPTKVQGVGSWTVSWMLLFLFFWTLLYFFAFHLVFGIPQSSLYVPFAVHYALTALLGPVFYVARRRVIASDQRSTGMLFVAATVFVFCTLACWVYFGIKLRIIPRDDETALCIITCVTSLVPLGAFLVRRLVSQKPPP